MLNGDTEGAINLVFVPPNVAPSLAPDEQSLVCISLKPGHEETTLTDVRATLGEWFGASVNHWRHLKTYHVPHALSSAKPGEVSLATMSHKIDGDFVCGDHCTLFMIDHALGSGISAGEAVLQDHSL